MSRIHPHTRRPTASGRERGYTSTQQWGLWGGGGGRDGRPVTTCLRMYTKVKKKSKAVACSFCTPTPPKGCKMKVSMRDGTPAKKQTPLLPQAKKYTRTVYILGTIVSITEYSSRGTEYRRHSSRQFQVVVPRGLIEEQLLRKREERAPQTPHTGNEDSTTIRFDRTWPCAHNRRHTIQWGERNTSNSGAVHTPPISTPHPRRPDRSSSSEALQSCPADRVRV